MDEIDTGLHYSVMTSLWKLVIATAARLDIQVFATTHSNNCIRALIQATSECPGAVDDVLLQSAATLLRRLLVPSCARRIAASGPRQCGSPSTRRGPR